MASITDLSPKGNAAYTLIAWLLTNGDPTGDRYMRPGAADRSVQFSGDFDSSTVELQGSNVPSPAGDADWHTLTDGNDNALQFTAPGLKNVAENCLWYRAKRTAAGLGSESVTVRLFSRRTI